MALFELSVRNKLAFLSIMNVSGINMSKNTVILHQLKSGVVIAVGSGGRSKDGNAIIPPTVKEGDTVLLPEYGGNEIKLGEKE